MAQRMILWKQTVFGFVTETIYPNARDWVKGTLVDIHSLRILRETSKTQRDFISGYATAVIVKHELEEKELNWLVEQSLKTPYYIAANLFASGMFSDYRSKQNLQVDLFPTLTVIAEHWAAIAKAFTQRISPQSSVEVLGGHMMFWEHSEKFNKIVDHFISNGK